MKKVLLMIVGFSLLTSCSQSIYYQMYQTKPLTDDIVVNENSLLYEDDNCVILYDFWGEYGNFDFLIYNKGEENIYLHLDECFFVVNGFAHDYYRNRVYLNSNTNVSSTTSSYSTGNMTSTTIANANGVGWGIGSTSYSDVYGTSNTYGNGYIGGLSQTNVNSSTNGVSIYEKNVICIPAKNKKIISEFNIKSNVYRDCDIFLYPRKNEKNTLEFASNESPYIFGNKLAYSIGDSDELIRINHDFYVSKISNYPMNEILKVVNKTNCGEELEYQKIKVFKESGPNQFYIRYGMNTNSSVIIKH